MSILKNARRERFAQEIVKGTTASEAYVIAGYKRDDGNASKLLANPEIQARIQEITSVALKKAGLTGEQVIAELGRIGLANMMDFMTIGADGLPFVDWSNLTREQAAAIGEIVVETRMESEVNEAGEREAVPVRKVRFKLVHKTQALELLGKYFTLWKERVEHSGTVTTETLDTDTLKAEILAEMAELGITPALPAMPEGVANKVNGANGKTKH